MAHAEGPDREPDFECTPQLKKKDGMKLLGYRIFNPYILPTFLNIKFKCIDIYSLIGIVLVLVVHKIMTYLKINGILD